MRRLLASMSVAVAVSAAGAASAHDATKVIFDLSELQRHTIQAPAPSVNSHTMLPMGSLPIGSPRESGRLGDVPKISESEDGLEISPKHGGAPSGGRIGGSPGGGKGGGPASSPNPEPGTMLLLGSGLAAGARFLRRRG